MKILFSLSLGASLLLLAASVSDTHTDSLSTDPVGFAVVELFTSQGCSSCPPADRVLSEWATSAEEQGLAVYPLSFHVDYWNYLGWEDPYSQEAFSQRQRAYARRMGNGRVYTPQMIVNGQSEFVGSNRTQASLAIQKGLGQDPALSLALRSLPASRGHLNLSCTLSREIPHSVELLVAVVESGLRQQVKRGENRGSLLTHTHVVRSLQVQPLQAKKTQATLSLSLPEVFNQTQGKLIVFIQEMGQGRILAAQALSLASSE